MVTSRSPTAITPKDVGRSGLAPPMTLSAVGEDSSWAREWSEMVRATEEGREPLGSGRDGYEALRLVEAIYQSSRTGQAVPV